MNIDGDVVTKSFATENFDLLIEDLVVEIELKNYRVTRINHIDNVLEQTERGLSASMNFEHYKIVEFCNLNSCARMMSADRLSGVFMPVKFIAYQSVGETRPSVSFLRPTRFAALFSAPRVMAIASELEKDMSDVLEEIAY